MAYKVHVCSFDSTLDLRGRALTYEAVKARVLDAGRFSVFEATDTPRRADLFTRLCQDPELVIETVGFPWTKVTKRDAAR